MSSQLFVKSKVKLSISAVAASTFVIISSVLGISTFLAAMTIPTFPIAHSRGNAPESPSPANFEECVVAGNPAAGGVPRVCKSGNDSFIEEVRIEDHFLNGIY